MAKQQEIGNRGEKLAAEYLQHKGYDILTLNWRYKRAEVDIIARDGEVVVFVEVKTRSYNLFGPPDLAVNYKKESLLTSAAHVWIEEHQHEGEIRFDVISILIEKNNIPKINHLEDAFFWGLDY